MSLKTSFSKSSNSLANSLEVFEEGSANSRVNVMFIVNFATNVLLNSVGSSELVGFSV